MCPKCLDSVLESKTKPNNFLRKLFLKRVYFVQYFDVFKKKLFQKIMWLSFSTIYHDLLIFTTRCNYFLCSLDPGKSIGNNYSITRPTKNILTREKGIFQFDQKVTWMKLKSMWKCMTFGQFS